MNNHIKRIKEIDRQLKAINKMIDQGEHIAAGLTVCLAVGANHDSDDYLYLQLSEFTHDILTMIVASLERSKYMRQVMLKSEYNEASEFFNNY